MTYTTRVIDVNDAGTIAFHRAAMFREMGVLTDSDLPDFQTASEVWLAELIAAGVYAGWFVEDRARVIAGGGLFLQEFGPTPECLRRTKGAHIANVYTDPQYRRQGLARQIMQTILHWCDANRIVHVSLIASDAGRPLYESLGFEQTAHMRLTRRATNSAG